MTTTLSNTAEGETLLPPEFSNLEPFARTWVLQTERERNAKRRASSMAEITAFYDAVVGRLPQIAAYLADRKRDSLEPRDQRLVLIALSLMEVAPAVELYHAPDVIDAAPAEQLVICEV